ncbi:MAG TPA: molybdate ABC transporter substrate-binding protein, partial [Pseudonocardia sp.]|nr:molybdate ABC transporter substrate-binding protein [Pseudonocardia sp.]
MRRLVALAGLVAVLAGCGSAAGGPDGDRELTVYAAASLTESFTALGERFEADNPGVTVRFNFGASSDLAQQIVNGAPADVFAAASDATMRTVGDAAGPPTVFATNVLQIVTAPGNPEGIQSFADL